MSSFTPLARKVISCGFPKNTSVRLGFNKTFKTLFCPPAPILMSNGLHIPPIGLGTMQIKDENSLRKAVRTAVNVGYRHIDTAFVFNNEFYLGKELQQMFKENVIMREQLFITTKLPQNGMRPENVDYFFKQSLNALKLDYVDLYLIHVPIPTQLTEDDTDIFPLKDGDILVDNVDLLETWKVSYGITCTMESHKGLVRSLGLSNCNSQQVQRIYDAATVKPTNLQVECHPYLQQHELQSFCKRLNITLTAYSPLGTPGLPEYSRTYLDMKYNAPKLLYEKIINEISKKHKKTPAQVLLRYLTQRGIIPIPKSVNERRLKENMESFNFDLDSEDFSLIKTMESGYRYFRFDFAQSFKDHPEKPF